jgi:hypothetical protein
MKPSEPLEEPRDPAQEFMEQIRWELIRSASMLCEGYPLTISERAALKTVLEVFDVGAPAWAKLGKNERF